MSKPKGFQLRGVYEGVKAGGVSTVETLTLCRYVSRLDLCFVSVSVNRAAHGRPKRVMSSNIRDLNRKKEEKQNCKFLLVEVAALEKKAKRTKYSRDAEGVKVVD